MNRVGTIRLRDPAVRDLFAILDAPTQPGPVLISLGVRWYDRLRIRFGGASTANAIAEWLNRTLQESAANSEGAPQRAPKFKNPKRELLDSVVALTWYYGIGYEAAMSLPVKVFALYIHRIERYRGIDLISGAQTASIPHMKDGDRKRLMRSWGRMMDPTVRLNGSMGLLDILKQAGKIE